MDPITPGITPVELGTFGVQWRVRSTAASNFWTEIERTSDGGGAPATSEWNTFRRLPPGSVVVSDDTLPPTTDFTYYRARHFKSGWDDGAWSTHYAAIPVEFSPDANERGGLDQKYFVADGYVGGFTATSDDLSADTGSGTNGTQLQADTERWLMGDATAPMTGVGIFMGLDGADYEFRAGNPSADYLHWDGTDLTITGEITATTGVIGGWTITATDITTGAATPHVQLESDTERILMGSATAPLTGEGLFLGKDGSDYEFRVGDPGVAGRYVHWDGTELMIHAATIYGAVFKAALTMDTGQLIVDTSISMSASAPVLLHSTSYLRWAADTSVRYAASPSRLRILDGALHVEDGEVLSDNREVRTSLGADVTTTATTAGLTWQDLSSQVLPTMADGDMVEFWLTYQATGTGTKNYRLTLGATGMGQISSTTAGYVHLRGVLVRDGTNAWYSYQAWVGAAFAAATTGTVAVDPSGATLHASGYSANIGEVELESYNVTFTPAT